MKRTKYPSFYEELNCMICGNPFMSPPPKMCCSGGDCGCMDQPIDPIVCSNECYQKLMDNVSYFQKEFKLELSLNKIENE
jgi:hypothetical protein